MQLLADMDARFIPRPSYFAWVNVLKQSIGVGYAHRRLSNKFVLLNVLVWHMHDSGMCQTNTSSLMMQAARPDQVHKALTSMFFRFHKGHRLSCGTDEALR